MSSEKVNKGKKQLSLDKNIITVSNNKNNVDNVDNVDSEKLKKTTSNNDDIDIEQQFSGLLETLGNLRGQITQIQNQVRTLEKNVKKQSKSNKKESKSRIIRKPSGFAKPSKISDELITFMNKTKGTELARTEVTQYIINYIKENSLQNMENRKNINPDKKLSDLLPKNLDKCFFPNSGAEANEGAIKLAYKYHKGKRDYILHSDRAFHGKLIATGSLGGNYFEDELFQRLPHISNFEYNNIVSLKSKINYLQKNGEYFGLRVKGDSMIEAGINDGDTVIIKKASTADTGQIAVVLIDEQEATLKRIRKKGNTIALEAANKNYDTKIYASNRIKIQGRLISLYRNFH